MSWETSTHAHTFVIISFDLQIESVALVRSLVMSPLCLTKLIPNCVKWTPSEEMTPCDSLSPPCSSDVILLPTKQPSDTPLPKIFFNIFFILAQHFLNQCHNISLHLFSLQVYTLLVDSRQIQANALAVWYSLQVIPPEGGYWLKQSHTEKHISYSGWPFILPARLNISISCTIEILI